MTRMEQCGRWEVSHRHPRRLSRALAVHLRDRRVLRANLRQFSGEIFPPAEGRRKTPKLDAKFLPFTWFAFFAVPHHRTVGNRHIRHIREKSEAGLYPCPSVSCLVKASSEPHGMIQLGWLTTDCTDITDRDQPPMDANERQWRLSSTNISAAQIRVYWRAFAVVILV